MTMPTASIFTGKSNHGTFRVIKSPVVNTYDCLRKYSHMRLHHCMSNNIDSDKFRMSMLGEIPMTERKANSMSSNWYTVFMLQWLIVIYSYCHIHNRFSLGVASCPTVDGQEGVCLSQMLLLHLQEFL